MSDETEHVMKCNKCNVVKPLEDFPRQKTCKNGRRPTCKICMAAKTKAWRDADPSRNKASIAACKTANPDRWREKDLARTKKYVTNNPEKVSETRKAYALRNSETIIENRKRKSAENVARALDWVKKNPYRAALNNVVSMNRRRARKIQATPSWADKQSVRRVYEDCAVLCASTGDKYEVDHIIPLRNKRVSGLHVANNLQIILAKENRKKSNTFNIEAFNER